VHAGRGGRGSGSGGICAVVAKLEPRCTSSDVGVMFRENAYDAGGCFMVDDFFCCLKI